jgi:pyruvate/2-oxoglutarate dehydrogenase complex dihydrolipoamide acyltransferase (E2) component
MARMTTRRKLAISTWSAPREGNIYGSLTLDAGKALEYIEDVRQRTGEKVTVTHLVGKAAALALEEAPDLNGRIVLGRFVPHKTVDLAFLVALENGKDLAKVKVERANEKTVPELAKELRTGAERLRGGRDASFEKSKGLLRVLPTFLLRPLLWLIGFLTGALGWNLPRMGLERFPFGSAIVTSVGMFGLDEGFAPPTPVARVPLYVLVGAIGERPAVVDGALAIRPQLTITATIDHRFIDGFQGGVLARAVRRVFDDPWSLEGSRLSPAPRGAGEEAVDARSAATAAD